MLIGVVAGALVTFSIQWLELIAVDDTSGSFSVHGLCGLWSLLAAGLFARVPGATRGQWIAQVVGIATLLGFMLPLSYGLNLLLDRVLPQRVPPEGERQGMDLHELGAGAYPEFVTYNEDFMQH